MIQGWLSKRVINVSMLMMLIASLAQLAIVPRLAPPITTNLESSTSYYDRNIVTQQEREVNSYGSQYKMLWDISSEGPIIPGLLQGIVPQGLAYYSEKNWLLISGYMDDNKPGKLFIVNASNRSLVKTVVLYKENGTPYTGHAGGVAMSRQHVWISSDQFLYQIELEALIQANDNDRMRFIARIPVPVRASFNTFSDGVLWVGEFYESKKYPTNASHHQTTRDGAKHHAWMVGYVLDPATDTVNIRNSNGNIGTPAVPDYILSITEKVQGASFSRETIILSTSYGRENDSKLYRYNNPLDEAHHTTAIIGDSTVPVWFLDAATEKTINKLAVIPPMSEGIVNVGNDLYVLLESGANMYRYSTNYIMDRMLKIDLKLWETYGTN